MTHRLVEHVGEVEVVLEAATEAGLFAEALEAFRRLVGGGGARGEPVTHGIELTAGDGALLLVDWLGELVFLAETAAFVPLRVATLEVTDGRLRATVEGVRGRPRHLVKAVTLNNLELDSEGGIWHGRVVLDV